MLWFGGKMPRNLVLFRALGGIAALIAVAFAAPAIAADSLPPKEKILSERVLGKADAPVTLIEYASLTCPHCANFAMETLPTIKKDYIETGKVKLIYRDFPLDRLALTASMMARCAPEDRYYGLIETLFRTQDTWARASDPGVALQRLGAVAGLSKENYDACVANREIFDGIVAMRGQAEQEHKVNSTPTFVLDGRKLTGDLSLPEVRKALDAAVAAKSK
jgi:protein-disulfide isomerase